MLDQGLFRHCGTEEIDGLVGTIDDTQEVLRKILYAIQDAGGGIIHLNRIIEEARRSPDKRPILTQVGRLVVGDIWKYGVCPFDLPVNWDTDVRRVKGVVAQDIKLANLAKKKHPSRKYIIYHPDPRQCSSLSNVCKSTSGTDFFELLAFRDKIAEDWIRDCRVLALGTNQLLQLIIDKNGRARIEFLDCDNPNKELLQYNDFVLVSAE